MFNVCLIRAPECFVEESQSFPMTPSWRGDILCHHVFLVCVGHSLLSAFVCTPSAGFVSHCFSNLMLVVFTDPSCLSYLLTQRKKWSRGPTTPPLDWLLASSPGQQSKRTLWIVVTQQYAKHPDASLLKIMTLLHYPGGIFQLSIEFFAQ